MFEHLADGQRGAGPLGENLRTGRVRKGAATTKSLIVLLWSSRHVALVGYAFLIIFACAVWLFILRCLFLGRITITSQ